MCYTRPNRAASGGFTLIETLVYLSLYAILFSGLLAGVYALFESDARDQTAAMLEEEGNFLIAKIDATIDAARSVQSPISSGDMLEIRQADGTSIVIQGVSTQLRIETGGNDAETLNNSDTSVKGLNFTHRQSSNEGANPESITATFTLIATTSDGHLLSQTFSTTDYLRI